MHLGDFNVKLSTGVWYVVCSPVAGLACYDRVMYINPDEPYSTQEFLATLCHETMHSISKDMPEAEVERASRDLAEVLWTAGYRIKVRKPRKKKKKK